MEPWRCGLCPLQTDANRYPQTPLTEDMPKIHLRCGHEYHTHCYMYRTMATEDLPCHERCPDEECGEYIFTEPVREFYRDDEAGQRAERNVVNMWNNNPNFRSDLKGLLQMRRTFLRQVKVFRPKYAELKRRFKEATRVHKEAILYEKRDCKQALTVLPERKTARLAMYRFNKELKEFLKKYDIWTSNLRALYRMPGVPRIPRRFGIPWGDRRAIGMQYQFRVRI
jgi:hypothetical protein